MVTTSSIITVLNAFFRSRHLQAVRRTIISVISAVIIVVIIWYILSGLGQSGLLDGKTIVSAFVTDVGIGVLLYVLLGEMRRSNEAEVVNLMAAAEKFSHLRVYMFAVIKYDFYYIENTITKQCYKSPEFVENIVDLGVVTVIKCKNEEEMKKHLEENKVMLNDREPSFIELTAHALAM
jgi:hypothetical protein